MKQESVVRWYLVLFFIKVSILGMLFIPRWEIPDEHGHFSYVADIAEGRGITVLGEFKIITFYYEDLEFIAPPAGNRIAQHPPLYYLSMAPFYKMAQSLGLDNAQTFHAIRILNGLLATFLLYVCYRLCMEVNSNSSEEIIAAIMLMGSVPMFSNIGAGVNNTMMLGLLFSLGLWQSVCYFNRKSPRYIYRAAAFMGLAGLTKYNVLPAILAWGVLFAFLEGFWKSKEKLLRVTLIAALCVLPVSAWIVRNYFLFEEFFPIYEKLDEVLKLDMSMLEVVRHYNVFERFYNGFFCLLGFVGIPGDGKVSLMSLPMSMRPLYQSLYVLLGAGALWQNWRHLGSYSKIKTEKIIAIIIVFISFILASAVTSKSTLLLFAGTCLWISNIGLVLSDFARNLKTKKTNHNLFIAAAYLILFAFIVTLAIKSYDFSIHAGHLRAAHGRYFFAFAGLLMIGFVLPGFKAFNRIGSRIFLIPFVAQLCEIYLWANFASHFYLR